MPENTAQPQTPSNQKPFNFKKVLVIVIAAAVLIGLVVVLFLILQPKESETGQVTTKKTTPSAKVATPSVEKDKTADWKTYENKEYSYSLKFPKSWYAATETKTVSQENNIVYHYYSVSNEKDPSVEVKDEVMVIRYLEGDPCAAMTIKKTNVTVSGYQGQRSNCYQKGKLKVSLFSFPDTEKEEWFLVAYFNKDPELVEEIISTFKFLD